MMTGGTLTSYAIAICGVAVLSILWVAVQNRWRQAFLDDEADPDVLARRSSCHGCKSTSLACVLGKKRPGECARPNEESWTPSGVTTKETP